MSLYQTQYPNNSRVVSGTPAIFKDDVVLLCDTSAGAVTINLLDIPDNYWSTTWKLYVVDNSNNASVNNITINAGTGQTINNQSSLVLSTNSVCAVISIASNTDFLGNLTLNFSVGGAVTVVNTQNPFTPPVTLTTALDKLFVSGFQTTNSGNDVSLFNAFVAIDTTQLDLLIANKTLIDNQIYKISGFKFGLAPELHNIFVKATSSNTIDVYGTGEFFNADYNNIGDYSTVSGFAGQLGIWQKTLTIVSGNVVIWNNYHWVNLSGSNTLVAPNMSSDWQKLPYSITNGYILEYDFIQWKYDKYYEISLRQDKYVNYVEAYNVGIHSLNRFQWGNKDVFQNKVIGKSVFDSCNVITQQALCNNYIFNTLLFLTDLNEPSLFLNFEANEFIDNQNQINIYCSSLNSVVEKNHFNLGVYDTLTTDILIKTSVTFSLNNFVGCELSLILQECDFSKNNISYSKLTLDKTSGTFVKNNITLSNLNLTSTAGVENNNSIYNSSGTITNLGNLLNNVIINSSISITENAVGASFSANLIDFSTVNISSNRYLITNNSLNNGSTITIEVNDVNAEIIRNTLEYSSISVSLINSGVISQNYLKQESALIVATNEVGATITYNSIENSSNINLTTNKNIFGSLSNKPGNVFSNSTINIDSSENYFSENNFYNTNFYILKSYGAWSLNTLNHCYIEISSTNNGTFDNLFLNKATFLIGTNNENFHNGSFIFRTIASNKVSLDCSDGNIYDLGTQTLTIPSQFTDFVGVFTLINCSGITIDKIIGLSINIECTFYSLDGTVTFNRTPVATISTNQMAAAFVTIANTITYRATVNDFIKILNQGTYNVITEKGDLQ